MLITDKAGLPLGYTEDEWRINLSNLIVDLPKYIRLKIAVIEQSTKFWINVQANLE
ncbi:hypothetical protein ACQFX9_07255 [Aliinostoc sp. HNIBRCY26]|uniref:hypothetical protein n=1 Tax=Aliinostoc sp. HNIBRCY26 TaxID=3418997 RepID=UPI003D0607E7